MIFLPALLGAALVVSPATGPLYAQSAGSPEPQTGAATPDAQPDEDRAQRVEHLLDQLANAKSKAAAEPIEQRILQAWHQSGSPTTDLLLERANAAIQKKDYALALEYLDTIVTLAPDFAEGWNKRATVYYMIDNYDLSIADIGRTLAIQPRHFGALSGLGMIFRELNDPKRALAAFRKTLEVHPYLGEARNSIEKLELEVEGRDI